MSAILSPINFKNGASMSKKQFVIHVSVLIEANDQILMVQEEYGQWNLPGGHLNLGEGLLAGAIREVQEETGLRVQPDYFIGIYTGLGENHYLNFVFHAPLNHQGEVFISPELLGNRRIKLHDILTGNPDEFRNWKKLNQILADYRRNQKIPLAVISEDIYG